MMAQTLVLLLLSGLLCLVGANRCPGGIPCSCTSAKAVDASAEDRIIIDCSRRAMTQIPYFQGYTEYKIGKILLYNNRITSVPSRQFMGLNVSEIVLDHNPLKDVASDAFQGVYGLISLSISSCNLTKVPDIFHHTPQLIDLSIGGNKIYEIPSGTFNQVKKLHFLDLSRNPLRFHASMFHGLEESLRHVKLNAMGLRRIPSHALTNLKYLDNIELQDNMFSRLDNQTFNHLPKNRYTHYIFDNNYINYIALDTFRDHPMPIYLDFHENQITNVDFLLADPCFYQASIIHLHGNRLQCDCRVYNLTKHGPHLKLHGRCDGPAQFRHLPLMLHGNPELHRNHGADVVVRSLATLGADFCNDKEPNKRYHCPCTHHHHEETGGGHGKKRRYHASHAHEMQCARGPTADVTYIMNGDGHHGAREHTGNGAQTTWVNYHVLLFVSCLSIIKIYFNH